MNFTNSYKRLHGFHFFEQHATMDPGDGIMVINKYIRGTSARPLHPAYNAYTNRHEFWALCNFVLNSVFQCLLSRLLPPPHPSTRASTMWPETGRGGERYSGPWLQVQVGVNPFGWATIDTCAVSGKHRSAIIGERRPRHRWPRSWGLVPSGTGGTGLIATFMAPRGRLMASLQAFVASFLLLHSAGIWQMRVKVSEGERFAWMKFQRKKRKIFPIGKIWRTWENCCLRNLIPF